MQGTIQTRRRVNALVTHAFKLDAAQQLIHWCRAPHIRLFQRLVADVWHTDRERLRFGVAFARDITLRYFAVFHFGDRLAGFAVQHEDHALFGGLHQNRRAATFPVRQVIQQRLRRQVEVPQIVMGGLEGPADFTGGHIYRNNRRTVFVIQLGTRAAEEVWRRVTGRHVNQTQFWIVGHGRPDVWRTTGISLTFRWQFGDVRITRIPCPHQCAGVHVECTHHARRFAGREVIRYATANDNHVTRNQRGRGLLVVARFHFAHADFQIHHAVVTEISARLAGVGVDGNQAGINGWQEQTTFTGGADGTAGGSRRLRCVSGRRGGF
ncbi:hypothetical protein SRABI106_00629 [Rahnella aquatilis]|nr:hypothetical protein SRABI106_00629 [Rahnella aquatilis]